MASAFTVAYTIGLYTACFVQGFYNVFACGELAEQHKNRLHQFWSVLVFGILLIPFIDLHLGLFLSFSSSLTTVSAWAVSTPATIVSAAVVYIANLVLQVFTYRQLRSQCPSPRAFLLLTIVAVVFMPLVIGSEVYGLVQLVMSLFITAYNLFV